jgi:hypothetical protein
MTANGMLARDADVLQRGESPLHVAHLGEAMGEDTPRGVPA